MCCDMRKHSHLGCVEGSDAWQASSQLIPKALQLNERVAAAHEHAEQATAGFERLSLRLGKEQSQHASYSVYAEP